MLLGDSGVGKSSILRQAFQGKFDSNSLPKTVGFSHTDI